MNFGNAGGSNTLTGAESAAGAPYSLGPISAGNNGVLKILGFTAGAITGTSAGGSSGPIAARFSADNTLDSTPVFVQIGSSTFVTTAATDATRGVACDLP